MEAVASHTQGLEGRVLLQGVPWAQYVALREITEGQGLQFTYLDGALEIMAPSEIHEESKTLISRLLETWAVEHRVHLNGFGSTTWRSEAKVVGAEADEAYKLGPLGSGNVPDLAIEVVVSSPARDKLQVYARLGVREVWRWRPLKKQLTVYQLTKDRYVEREISALLPQLDLATLVAFAGRRGEDQTDLILEYRATLSPAI